MTSSLPASLAAWREAPRVRRLKHGSLRNAADVLCWLQQALVRGADAVEAIRVYQWPRPPAMDLA